MILVLIIGFLALFIVLGYNFYGYRHSCLQANMHTILSGSEACISSHFNSTRLPCIDTGTLKLL